jgi:hypothetical protein
VSEIDESCSTYELSSPLETILTLHFNQNRQVIYQNGQRVFSEILSSPLAIQYDEDTQQITEVERLDRDGQSNDSTYLFTYDHSGRLISHGEQTNEHHEHFSYVCIRSPMTDSGKTRIGVLYYR